MELVAIRDWYNIIHRNGAKTLARRNSTMTQAIHRSLPCRISHRRATRTWPCRRCPRQCNHQATAIERIVDVDTHGR
eukprot:scaffold152382_cov29-Tisochrysis_lutea.AAC.1